MSTFTGQEAENRAANFLKLKNFSILDQNWRTRYCEIDIVAKKQKVVWFVEVKFRRSSSQGFGYEYVTSKKVQQMQFAAELWVNDHHWNGEYRLAVISVDGEEIQLIDTVDLP